MTGSVPSESIRQGVVERGADIPGLLAHLWRERIVWRGLLHRSECLLIQNREAGAVHKMHVRQATILVQGKNQQELSAHPAAQGSLGIDPLPLDALLQTGEIGKVHGVPAVQVHGLLRCLAGVPGQAGAQAGDLVPERWPAPATGRGGFPLGEYGDAWRGTSQRQAASLGCRDWRHVAGRLRQSLRGRDDRLRCRACGHLRKRRRRRLYALRLFAGSGRSCGFLSAPPLRSAGRFARKGAWCQRRSTLGSNLWRRRRSRRGGRHPRGSRGLQDSHAKRGISIDRSLDPHEDEKGQKCPVQEK